MEFDLRVENSIQLTEVLLSLSRVFDFGKLRSITKLSSSSFDNEKSLFSQFV